MFLHLIVYNLSLCISQCNLKSDITDERKSIYIRISKIRIDMMKYIWILEMCCIISTFSLRWGETKWENQFPIADYEYQMSQKKVPFLEVPLLLKKYFSRTSCMYNWFLALQNGFQMIFLSLEFKIATKWIRFKPFSKIESSLFLIYLGDVVAWTLDVREEDNL